MPDYWEWQRFVLRDWQPAGLPATVRASVACMALGLADGALGARAGAVRRALDTIMSMRFVKGHGTGNDFVILPDPDSALALSARLVAELCDRHTGLGADGVLRVVRTEAAGVPQAAGQAAEWFMDYRNADGSEAEMCGNGIRVFARFLLDRGLAAGPEIAVATRSGTRVVQAAAGGEFSVDMGPAEVLGPGSALLAGRPVTGLAISVGNPHLACLVAEPVAGIDLSAPPVLDPDQFPAGANVEVLRITGERRVEMRVYERGSGATLSCGTGAVATAVAAASAAGEWPEPARPWTVDVPGGRLAVTPGVTASLLTGPAVLVAAGELDPGWLAARSPAAVSGIV